MKSMVIRTGMVALLAALLFTTGIPAAPAAAVGGSPTLTSPVSNSILTSFGPTLTWTNPPGATQVHLQVIPYNNDGASIDLYFGSATARFSVPPPPAWYGMLPDMTYTWRVRVSDKTTAASLTDPSWGPWVERKFRTPAVSSSTIMPLTPAVDDTVSTLTPSLQWGNSRTDVFYYEVQLSKDATFNTDPNTATAMIYAEYKHGGVTNPLNSYAVPTDFPLEAKTTYYWRVRARVQGDGVPTAWSDPWTFKTDVSASPKVTSEVAKFGLTPADATNCQITGSAASFSSTPTLTGLYYGFKYTGLGSISVNSYRDDIPRAAIGRDLDKAEGCVNLFMGLPEGAVSTLVAGPPMTPGKYRLDIWHAGQKVQSSTVTIAPATALTIGPISVGTEYLGCVLAGKKTTFPTGTKTVAYHLNRVGSGSYAIRVYQGNTPTTLGPYSANGPIGCNGGTLNLEAGWPPGTHRIEALIDGRVVQSVAWTLS